MGHQPTSPVALALADLVAPIGVETFLKDYYERRFVHLRQASPQLENLFNRSTLESFLYAVRPQGEHIRFVRDGVLLPVPEGLTPDAVLRAVAGGTSIAVHGPDKRWLPLRRFTDALAVELTANVTVNAYLTPARAKAFPLHMDRHDVLILQVEGSKTWFVGGAQDVDRPVRRRGPTTRAMFSSELDGNAGLGNREPVEIEMTVGDVLYIPRGVHHRALTRDEHSLHLTVGIMPIQWNFLLRELVDQVAMYEPALRDTVPREIARGETAPGLGKLFRWLADLADTHESRVDVGRVASTLWALRDEGEPTLEGRMEVALGLETVQLDTILEVREGLVPRLDWIEGAFSLECGDIALRGPVNAAPLAEFTVSHRRFRVADLPDAFSANSKLVWARRLLREGIARVGS